MEAPLEPSVLVSSLKGLRLQDRKVRGSVELLIKAWYATLPLEAGWCLARYTRQGGPCICGGFLFLSVAGLIEFGGVGGRGRALSERWNAVEVLAPSLGQPGLSSQSHKI